MLAISCKENDDTNKIDIYCQLLRHHKKKNSKEEHYGKTIDVKLANAVLGKSRRILLRTTRYR